MSLNVSFVKISEKTAPKIINSLTSGEGSNVIYATMNNGKFALSGGQSIKSTEARQAVIDKITNYVNKLENKSMENAGESFIAIA